MRSIQLDMFCSLCELLSIEADYEMEGRVVSLKEVRKCSAAKMVKINALDTYFLTVYVKPLDSFLIEAKETDNLTILPLIEEMRNQANTFLSRGFSVL
ncbi:hypothetical protein JCM19233_4786 [Vibrio astriarenae]|nr:hypothetical protein JCM19233_4786 [Vibrio sp. C7]